MDKPIIVRSADVISRAVASVPPRWKSRLSWAAGGVILAMLLLPAAQPYLKPGYQLGHDRIVPFMRVQALEHAISAGQIPPRWFPEFDGGYGSPYPSFYGMFFYYVAALFDACCTSVGPAVELTAFLTLAVSGLGMFFLAKSLWGTPAGILSAALYVYAPYHLVDAYVRGAYSELTTFVWFPLIVLSMLGWSRTRRRGWVLGGAFSLAGLVITHNIIPMIFLPVLPLLALGMVADPRTLLSDLDLVKGWAGMALFGALLSAYFWLPVVFDRHLIHQDYFLQVNYRDEFVGFAQLLGTTLTHGLTSEIGVPLLISSTCGLTAAYLTARRQISTRLLMIGAGLTLGYVLLMNYRSGPIWSNLPLLQFVQLPWRLLAPVTFFLCLAAGALPGSIHSWHTRWLLALAIPVIAIQIHKPLISLPHLIDSQSLSKVQLCGDIWGTQDYRPVWANTAFWRSAKPPEATDEKPVTLPCQGTPIFGSAESHSTSDFVVQSTGFSLKYSAGRPDTIRLPIFYYPTWRVEIDGSPIPVGPEPITGLIRLQVPAGEHIIMGNLGRTLAQTVGIILTLIGVALAILMIAWILKGVDPT